MQAVEVEGGIMPRPALGLVDGASIELRCSGCRARLAEAKQIRPDKDLTWTFQVKKCPWCGDHSFKESGVGIFSFAGASTPDPKDSENAFQSTRIDDIDLQGSHFALSVVPAPRGTPLY